MTAVVELEEFSFRQQVVKGYCPQRDTKQDWWRVLTFAFYLLCTEYIQIENQGVEEERQY